MEIRCLLEVYKTYDHAFLITYILSFVWVIPGGSIKNYSQVIQQLCSGVFGRFRHIFEMLIATSLSEGRVFCYRPIGIRERGEATLYSHHGPFGPQQRKQPPVGQNCLTRHPPHCFQPPSGDRIGTLISTPCKIIAGYIVYVNCILMSCLGNPTIVL